MTTFTINPQNEIVASASAEAAAAASATPFDTFTSQRELTELTTAWPPERLVAIWNSLAGVMPVKSFRNHRTAVSRLWTNIQSLRQNLDGGAENLLQPKPSRKAKSGALAATVASSKTKSGKKATTTKKATQGKKAAKSQDCTGPKAGSKTALVVAMLQRKNGASLTEIMEKMSWQKHTVRGFMAGAMKKAGYSIESFKPEGGERSYRINP